MPAVLNNARVFTPTEVIERGCVVVSDDGLIAYVGPVEDGPRASGPLYDMPGLIVAPGFVDIHVHGGNGITFGEGGALAEDLKAYSQWVAGCGVTGFLCSVAAPDEESLLRIVAEYAGILPAGGMPGAVPLGLHLEGPYLSKERPGAFNPMWLRDPSLEEATALLEAGGGWILQMTLAPELPHAREVAALLRQAGVVASLGHTNVDYDTASAALQSDFTHVTHTCNAMRGFHHREPGALGAILASDAVTAELIADTIHVHPGAMKVLVRCLGSDRVVLITDAMAGAGLGDGQYDLVGHTVTVKDGRATLPDGTIAGSTATLDDCVRNMHQKVGVPLVEAVKMASLNPARAMGLTASVGSIAVGREANLVVMDENVNVHATLVKGRVVYGSL
ncbi:MAG: N-acetylglucosamine-6-phosphate deacetylase [Anaerolineae bacterium]|nr:N-acetylglucosamine-6-phosphate deacetylase [Anaerolineae bacterium]